MRGQIPCPFPGCFNLIANTNFCCQEHFLKLTEDDRTLVHRMRSNWMSGHTTKERWYAFKQQMLEKYK